MLLQNLEISKNDRVFTQTTEVEFDNLLSCLYIGFVMIMRQIR